VFGLESEFGKGTRAFAEFPPERVQKHNRAA